MVHSDVVAENVARRINDKVGSLSPEDIDDLANIIKLPAFGTRIMKQIPEGNTRQILIDKMIDKNRFTFEEADNILTKPDKELTATQKVTKERYNIFFKEILGKKTDNEIQDMLRKQEAIRAGPKNGLPPWVNTKNFVRAAMLAVAFGFTVFCIDESISAERDHDRCMRDCVPAFRTQFTLNPSKSSGDYMHYWALDTAQHWRTVPTESSGRALCTYANLTKLREDGTIDGIENLQLPERGEGQLYSATCDDFCRISCGQLKETVGTCMGQQVASATELVMDITIPIVEEVVETVGDITEEAGTTISDFFTDVVDGTGWILFGVLAVLLLLVFT